MDDVKSPHSGYNRDTDPDLTQVVGTVKSAAEALLIDEHRINIEAILKDGIQNPAKIFGSTSFSISAGTRPDGVSAPWEPLFMEDSLGSWKVTFTTDRFFDHKFRGFSGIDLMGNTSSRSLLSAHPIVKMFTETLLSNSENITVNAIGQNVLRSHNNLVLPLKIEGLELGQDTDVSIKFSYSSPDGVNIVLSSLEIHSQTGVQQFNFEYKKKLLHDITDKFYEESLRNTVEQTEDHSFLRKVIVGSQSVLELSTITATHLDKDDEILESYQDHLSSDDENMGVSEWIREHYDHNGRVMLRSYVGVVRAKDLKYWESQKSVISRLGIPKDFDEILVWNQNLAKDDTKTFPTLAELASKMGRGFLLRVVQKRNSDGVFSTVALAADELPFGETTLEVAQMTKTVEWEKVVALPVNGTPQNITLHFGQDPSFASSN